MENCERNLISWMSQKKAAGEVSQVGPERRKKDLLEPGTNIWFTESFVNIFKFSFNFFEVIYWRAWIGEAAADCTLGSCIQLYPALQVKLVLLVMAFLTWLKSFSPCCHPLYTFDFLLYFMEWGGLSLSCTTLMLSWETGSKNAISVPLFPSLPQSQVYLHSLWPPLCTCSSAPGHSSGTKSEPPTLDGTKLSHLKLKEIELFMWLLLHSTEKLPALMQLLQLLRTSDPSWCPGFLNFSALDENNS